MNILIFGDSIAQGFWDSHGGWAQRLAHDYHSRGLSEMLTGLKDYPEVFNLGVSGDTAEDLAKRFELEAKARLSETETVIVIAVGMNDAKMRDNRAVTDVYKFQETLENIIKRAQKITEKIIFVGISAVDESRTNPFVHSDQNSQWTNNRINTFEDTIKQTAERNQLPFVPVHDHFLASLESGQDLLADGLHPNEAGHQLIVELVKPVLNEACYTN